MSDYNAGINLKPKFIAEYYNNRGALRETQGDVKGAFEDYAAALSADPKYPVTYKNRGVLRQRQNDLTGASEDFAKALACAPPNWRYRAEVEQRLAAVRASLPK
jgi:tetratricopeptide (TPR) repeat protein